MRKVFFVGILAYFLFFACRPPEGLTEDVPTETTLAPLTTKTPLPTMILPTPTEFVWQELVLRIEWAEKGVREDFMSSSEVNSADTVFLDDPKYYADFAVVVGEYKYSFVRFNTWVDGEKVIYAQIKTGKGDLATWVKLVRKTGEMEYGSEVVPTIRWMLRDRVVFEYPSEFVCEGEPYKCYTFYPPYYTPIFGFGRADGFPIFSENIEEIIKKVLN